MEGHIDREVSLACKFRESCTIVVTKLHTYRFTCTSTRDEAKCSTADLANLYTAETITRGSAWLCK